MKKTIQNNDDSAHAFPFASIRWIIIVMLWVCLQAGCAVWPEPTRSVHIGQTGPVGQCADFFASLDSRTAKADALDSGYGRVKQHPYLRTDRFIASFRDDVRDSHAFRAWVDQMQALDQSARQYEIANLSDADIAAMDSADSEDALFRMVVDCGNLLKASELLNAGLEAARQMDVSVQDEYIFPQRVLGLYPITSIFVLHGVEQWHAQARERFTPKPPADWQSIRYAPAAKPDTRAVHRILPRVERDALGIPIYSVEDRDTLFKTYAPIWEVQTQGDADRIGAPAWSANGHIAIDTARPQTYTHLSFTRFDKTVLTQLNYIIWFPSRPKAGAVDIYAGLLDGLNFRVTLDENGSPMLYETIHNCGCYYKAYPTNRLQVKESMPYKEPPLIFDAPQIDYKIERMVVGMASRTHYVNHLYPLPRNSKSNAIAYRLADYGELKSLPHNKNSRKSMFNRYGLVSGTERLERFLLWITGVPSPGAMRQWGRHAVAFVGKRHFDDPFYLDKMFVLAD